MSSVKLPNVLALEILDFLVSEKGEVHQNLPCYAGVLFDDEA